ncbi:co-chaperonin GroES (HSP10) [Thermonema lapsum]|uniref:Co-chaperonin GroES (HSP10) n=1 Tax=Thermonema lapsum TaxID=28195 RepID=A0A846MM92_9BACT|nr:co-chaperone GroES family protein [Thermonema lapsum]NIK72663.1 co-chaperonin GroES (HSP10) [Thermonema lapsum]
MILTKDNKLKNIIMVGDRVLIKPKVTQERTESGLYLPPGVQEKEKVQSGYVIKVGPGYPVPLPPDIEDEPWKEVDERVRYIPLQVKEGDFVLFLQKGAVEIQYEGERYYIVPQHSILMIERDEDLFN